MGLLKGGFLVHRSDVRNTDEEIEHYKDDNTAISFTLLRLSKMTKVERAFSASSEGQTNAAIAGKFLYGKDGMPK